MSYAKVAFISGYKSHATELPNASLFEAQNKLKVHYEPTNVETVYKVLNKYNKSQLEENQDLEECISQSDEICLHLQIDYKKETTKMKISSSNSPFFV